MLFTRMGRRSTHPATQCFSALTPARSLVLRALLLVFLAALLVPASARARTIRLDLAFADPVVTTVEDGQVTVEVSGCRPYGLPGSPLLPVRPVSLLIPPGEEIVAVHVTSAAEQTFPGTNVVAPAQAERPIDDPGPFPPTPPDPAIYGSDAPFPAERALVVTEQTAWGHRVAILQVYPVQSCPLSGRLVFVSALTLEVETAARAGADPNLISNLRRTDEVLTYLAKMVDNPDDLALYGWATARPPESGYLGKDYYPYVIITVPELVAGYAQLAVFESSRGLRAKVVLLSDILPHYPGVDPQEQIRNFIIDAYHNWGTKFVLLGGDADVIPARALFHAPPEGFPGECYYEGVDGNWNADGDACWGEWNPPYLCEPDLIGEVAVGRVTADNLEELGRWMHKNEMYSEHPVVEEVERAFFYGEDMTQEHQDPYWLAAPYIYALAHGSSECDYTTVGYPESYDKYELYETYCIHYDGPTVIGLLNQGFPTSHHLGHSNDTKNMRIVPQDLPLFSNDGVAHSYIFMYSMGCEANEFDFPTVEAISERFLVDEHAAAAYLGYTRRSYFVTGSICGSSEHYARQFVDACHGEGISTIEWMNIDSKNDNLWLGNLGLFSHYELCLLGDPAMPQWKQVDGQIVLTHSGRYDLGQGEYEVRASLNGSGSPGITVTIYRDDLSVWVSGVTDEQGIVWLDPDPSDCEPMHVKAVRQDCLPAESDIAVSDLRVLCPNGGEVTALGHPVTITWSGNALGSPTVNLYVNRQGAWEFLAAVPTSQHEFVWTPTGATSTGAEIQVMSNTGLGVIYDRSDASFPILDLATQAPTNLVCTAAADCRTFTWTPHSEHAVRYDLYKRCGTSLLWQYWATSDDDDSYVYPGCANPCGSPGTRMDVKVVAVFSLGCGGPDAVAVPCTSPSWGSLRPCSTGQGMAQRLASEGRSDAPREGITAISPLGSGFRIALALPIPGAASLSIFDAAGRQIWTEGASVRDAGPYEVTWDGRDPNGRRVAPGVYFARLSGVGLNSRAKVIVMR